MGVQGTCALERIKCQAQMDKAILGEDVNVKIQIQGVRKNRNRNLKMGN